MTPLYDLLVLVKENGRHRFAVVDLAANRVVCGSRYVYCSFDSAWRAGEVVRQRCEKRAEEV